MAFLLPPEEIIDLVRVVGLETYLVYIKLARARLVCRELFAGNATIMAASMVSPVQLLLLLQGSKFKLAS